MDDDVCQEHLRPVEDSRSGRRCFSAIVINCLLNSRGGGDPRSEFVTGRVSVEPRITLLYSPVYKA